MEHVVLKATKRDVVGTKVGALRRQGKLPAVLYGHRIETTPILLDAYEGSQMLSHLTSSSLVTIDLDGKQYLAQVRRPVDPGPGMGRLWMLRSRVQGVGTASKRRGGVGSGRRPGGTLDVAGTWPNRQCWPWQESCFRAWEVQIHGLLNEWLPEIDRPLIGRIGPSVARLLNPAPSPLAGKDATDPRQ